MAVPIRYVLVVAFLLVGIVNFAERVHRSLNVGPYYISGSAFCHVQSCQQQLYNADLSKTFRKLKL